MNTDKFEFVLNGLCLPEIKNGDLKSLTYAIQEIFPKAFFRYRSCNEQNFSAFNDDLIYAVTPNKFNDVYDTLPYYNREHIQKINQMCDLLSLAKYMQSEKMRSMLKCKGYEIKNFDEHNKEDVYSLLSDLIPLYADDFQVAVRKCVHVACFSEVVDSVIMWSHYAQNHEGFVLEYDLSPMLAKNLMLLMPVIYKNERYDAIESYLWYILVELGYNVANPDKLNVIRAILYKSMAWEYEKEWRLVFAEQSRGEVMSTSFKPKAIYYGAKISKINRKILHNMAKEKGLEEYEMCVISDSNEYKMEYRKC